MIDIHNHWPGEAGAKGKPMAYIDLLKYLKFDDLTDAERRDLRQRFQKRKSDLEAAIRTIEQGLATLERRYTAKKAAKRKRAKKK